MYSMGKYPSIGKSRVLYFWKIKPEFIPNNISLISVILTNLSSLVRSTLASPKRKTNKARLWSQLVGASPANSAHCLRAAAGNSLLSHCDNFQ